MSNTINFSESQMSKRVKLSDVVPLEKPFTVNFSVSNICNLRCEYCTFTDSKTRKEKASLSNRGIMDMSLFIRAVDDIKKSFGHIKQVVLVGGGEPLLNPNIADMVLYIKKQDIADRIDIVTNGVALTEKLSDQLIENGLTYLRVSVNGLSDDDFKKYTSIKVDFEKYIKRLTYFFEHRAETKIYVKIINYMVATNKRKKLFYNIFTPICDIINIENLHTYGGDKVDYGKIVDTAILNRAKFYNKKFKTNICSMPFYYINIDTDGSVYPCCESVTSIDYDAMGNIMNDSLKNIWNNKILRFQRKMLNGIDNMPYCKSCTSASAWVRPEDILDDHVKEIVERFDKNI